LIIKGTLVKNVGRLIKTTVLNIHIVLLKYQSSIEQR